MMSMTKFMLGMTLTVAVVAAQAKMLPNSYIVRPAPSLSSLISQVKAERILRDRYQRHYGMTTEEVLAFLGTLHEVHLGQAGVFTVYNVPKATGELRMRVLKLKKGERVYADASGVPQVVGICGNPMNRGPKGSTSDSVVVADVVASGSDAILAMTEPMQLTGEQESPMFVTNAEPSIPAEVIVNNHETVTPELPVLHSRNQAGLLLIPLALIGTYVVTKKGHDVPVVPEPAPIVAMGLGIATIAILKRRK
jgi:hypothetical protein